MARTWTSSIVSKGSHKVMRTLFLNLLQKLLLMKLMSMTTSTVLITCVYHITFTTLHLNWTWKSYCSCSRWILVMLILTKLNSAQFTRVFGHLKTMCKTSSAVWSTILIWHVIGSRSHGRKILVTFVVILASMTSRPTLWNEMSPSYLWSWTSTSTSCAVLAEVVESFWLLLLYKMAMLRISIILALWNNWWNKTRRALWTYSYLVNVSSSLVIDLNNPWLVLLSYHILWLLRDLESFCCVGCNLLYTGCSTYWSSHWVALLITWSLAVVAFFFNDKLIRLSVSFLAVHFEILLMLTLELLMWVIETTKFLFALIWCQFRISAALWKNCWDWNSSTRVNFTFCNKLICCWTLWLWCMALTTLWTCTSNAWNFVEISFNRIFVLTLMLIGLSHKSILNSYLLDVSIHSSDAIRSWNSNISLTIKSAKLWLVLNEIVLTIL